MYGDFPTSLLRVVEVSHWLGVRHCLSIETHDLGAFLIPYFILYFLIGAPLYYLELALGKFSSRGHCYGDQ